MNIVRTFACKALIDISSSNPIASSCCRSESLNDVSSYSALPDPPIKV